MVVPAIRILAIAPSHDESNSSIRTFCGIPWTLRDSMSAESYNSFRTR